MGCSALSASARYRKTVEVAPPEAAAAAGAGESHSRSHGAGASAPFLGCGVIHPARPRLAALKVHHVSIPGSPGPHLPDPGIEPAKGPCHWYPFFPYLGPFPHLHTQFTSCQSERKGSHPQPIRKRRRQHRSLVLLQQPAPGSGDAVLTPAHDFRLLTPRSYRPLPWQTRLPPRDWPWTVMGGAYGQVQREGSLASGRMPWRRSEGRGEVTATSLGSGLEGPFAS